MPVSGTSVVSTLIVSLRWSAQSAPPSLDFGGLKQVDCCKPWIIERNLSPKNQWLDGLDRVTVGMLEEGVSSVLSQNESIHIFGNVPSCLMSPPHRFENLGLGRCFLFRALLFYFILLYLLHSFLQLHCSSPPVAQVNIIQVPKKTDIVVSDPPLTPKNIFYLPLSKWEDSNA
ncbi:hypothetical protein AMTRI_Chr05g61330 [Amborella trichopoda]